MSASIWSHVRQCRMYRTADIGCVFQNLYDHCYEINTKCMSSSTSNPYVFYCSDLSGMNTVNVQQSRWDDKSAVVYPNIISEIQEVKLASIIAEKFQRRRYEKGHWDSVIQNYREVELFDEEIDNLNLFLQPIRQFIEERHDTSCSTDPSLHFSGTWLPCHAIDLHKDGELNAHVDSVRFSGNLVAGLSLLSDAIMRLKPSSDSSSNDASQEKGDSSNEYIDLFLPRRSLYVLSGMSRYEYTHELLPSGSRFQDKSPVQRDRRLSIIFRDTKLQHCC